MMHVQMNQPANSGSDSILDIEAMKKLYGTRGYMAVSIQARSGDRRQRIPPSNTCCGSTRATFTPWETWTFVASTRAPTARLQDDWRLRGGDPYDSSYPKRFLDQEDKEISVLADWDASVRESLNPNEKTVDVTLRFNQKPR